MNKAFCGNLIAAVEERPPLWQPNHIDFKNKCVTYVMWDKIGEICHCTGYLAKAKWKALKDTFRKNYNDSITKKPDPKARKWRYFDQMMFIKDTLPPPKTQATKTTMGTRKKSVVARKRKKSETSESEGEESVISCDSPPPPRLTNGNGPEIHSMLLDRLQDEEQSVNVKYEQNVIEVENEDENELSEPICHLAQDQAKRFRAEETPYAVESSRQENHKSKSSTYDDDLQFFKSLIPFMENFNDVQKLELRGEIQNTILNKLKRSQS